MLARIACLCVRAGVPFGGYKDSGVGREKSEYALQSYTQVRPAVSLFVTVDSKLRVVTVVQ